MPTKSKKQKANEISCLYEISNAIYATLDLKKSLFKVLDLMAEYLKMNRGSIAILNSETSEIHIEVAHGMSSTEKSKGRYKLGEGITGRVIKTGRPIVPCAILGAYEALPVKAKFLKFTPLKVKISKPIFLLKEFGTVINDTYLQEGIFRIKNTIKEMVNAG